MDLLDLEYNSQVLQQLAEMLYARATATIVIYALVGLAAGAVVGSLQVITTHYPGTDPTIMRMAFALAGGVVAGLIGYLASLRLRVMAQMVLCFMQIELNTRQAVSVPVESLGLRRE